MSSRYQLHLGDCLETLKTLPDSSIDAVVCDPPYGLSKEPDMAEVLKHWLAGDDYKHHSSGFMGKTWDSFVPGPSIWKECLRVLKPGGHLLAFAGTRTQDLMALSIRLAGFHIRDSIAWMHSGDDDALNFVDSLTPAQRDAFYRLQDQGDARWTWAYGSGFPKSMDVSKTIDKMAGSTRAVIGRASYGDGHVQNSRESIGYGGSDPAADTRFITAPATEAAQRFSGFGTALKPAHEPIVVARKPFSATVAANVMAHGTGALNIDGCRVGTEAVSTHSRGANGAFPKRPGETSAEESGRKKDQRDGLDHSERTGRWPANLIHDGSDEVVALFPVTKSGVMKAGTRRAAQDGPGSVCYGTYGGDATSADTYGDAGSAARFFYAAKASRADRNEGLRDAENLGDDRKGNTHPCVKPTSLMAYLCRLVTPPGGTVLDPFMGSGSTGKAAMREGFQFIGCELDPQYLEIARKRIEFEAQKSQPNREAEMCAPKQADIFAQTDTTEEELPALFANSNEETIEG